MVEKSSPQSLLEAPLPAPILYIADSGLLRRERFTKKYLETFASVKGNPAEVILLDGRFFSEKDLDEFRNSARSLSLFSGQKFVHVKFADSLLAPMLAHLASEFAALSPAVNLIFSGAPLPERSVFKKNIEKHGTYFVFEEVKGPELKRWIKKEAKQWGIQTIDDTSIELIVELSGGNLDEAQRIVERAGLYSEDGKVDRSMLLTLFSRTHSSTEFEAVDAILAGDKKKASVLQNQLIFDGLNPYGFVPLAARGAFNLCAYYAAQHEGFGFERIKAAFGLSPWIANKLSTLARRSSFSFSQKVLSNLLEAEFRLKSKSLSHADCMEAVLDTGPILK